MVDAQRLARRGARGIGAAARELRAQLLIVEYQPVGIVRDLKLVARLHIRGARKVAADPRGQARARVGARGQLRPVQSSQGRVSPVEVGAAVGAQKMCRPPGS